MALAMEREFDNVLSVGAFGAQVGEVKDGFEMPRAEGEERTGDVIRGWGLLKRRYGVWRYVFSRVRGDDGAQSRHREISGRLVEEARLIIFVVDFIDGEKVCSGFLPQNGGAKTYTESYTESLDGYYTRSGAQDSLSAKQAQQIALRKCSINWPVSCCPAWRTCNDRLYHT